MAEKNEVQVTFSDLFANQLELHSSALPKYVNKDRIVQEGIAVLNGNTQLQQCNKAQLLAGLMRGAYLGLSFLNAECYLVPFGSTVQFLTSYKGACKFAKKYSVRRIKDIYAKVVREGDVFEEKIVDGHPSVDFKPVPFSESKIVGVFAIVLFEDGGMIYETMTTQEVNDTRNNYSRAKNSPSWQKSWTEMAKKTIIHRILKTVEVDFESIEAKESWDDGLDSNVVQQRKTDEIVDVFASPKNFAQNVNDVVDNSQEVNADTNIIDEGSFEEIPDDDLPEFFKKGK